VTRRYERRLIEAVPFTQGSAHPLGQSIDCRRLEQRQHLHLRPGPGFDA
jgi:hypothetical protein